MEKLTWVLLVFMAGALLPLQAGLNGKMGKALENPGWAVFISFLVGAIALFLYLIVSRSPLPMNRLSGVPGYTWIAGVLGAAYVLIVVLAFPRLGAALTFGLIVAGQMTISLLLDHFNVLVLHQQPVNIYRVIGVLLIVAGVVVLRKW